MRESHVRKRSDAPHLKRKSSTDPDVTMTAVMLSTLRTAVEITTGKRPTADPPRLGARAAVVPDPRTIYFV
jgi:hypothetical protein